MCTKILWAGKSFREVFTRTGTWKRIEEVIRTKSYLTCTDGGCKVIGKQAVAFARSFLDGIRGITQARRLRSASLGNMWAIGFRARRIRLGVLLCCVCWFT